MKHNNILILGASGMLGSELFRQFIRNKDLNVAIALRNFNKLPESVENNFKYIVIPKDFMKFYRELYKTLSNDNYLVINCIGLTNRFESDNPMNVVEMITTNSILPNVLAGFQREFKDSTFVNVSTNCVFKDGKSLDNSYYGLSKKLGESNHLITIRTSLIGEESDSTLQLVEWFKEQKGSVNGYTKAFWNGITTKEFFNIVNDWNLNNTFPDKGIYNITSSNIVSKYELLELLKDKFGKGIVINKDTKFKENKTLKQSLKINYKQKTVQKMIEELELRS